jgi:hypothetical protein
MSITAVNVLNNNGFPLEEDRYNGVLYTFAPRLRSPPRPPGTSSGGRNGLQEAFLSSSKRWGWNTKQTAPCKNIIVRPVELETVEIVSMPHPPRSSPPERKRELTRMGSPVSEPGRRCFARRQRGDVAQDDVTHGRCASFAGSLLIKLIADRRRAGSQIRDPDGGDIPARSPAIRSSKPKGGHVLEKRRQVMGAGLAPDRCSAILRVRISNMG